MGRSMKDPQSAAFVFDRGAVEPGTKAGWTQQSLENGEPMLPATGQFNPGSQPFLKMNLHGERFFNESANYDWAPHAAASQPGGVYLEVWDAASPKTSSGSTAWAARASRASWLTRWAWEPTVTCRNGSTRASWSKPIRWKSSPTA